MPASLLANCRIGRQPLYFVGTFDSGVTVLSQQIRALNLAHAFVESGVVRCKSSGHAAAAKSKPHRIAIIGGGFAGLTFAAAMLEKGADAEISIFEERDTLLPLQQGSDSRWLHPRVYNWPEDNSESPAAMLPVLNWTAARASDVTVQILTEWNRVVKQRGQPLRLYCNTRHLQIEDAGRGSSAQMRIEWVGEEREAADATVPEKKTGAIGKSERFDFVILAIGFGLERDDAHSYWRNEVLGQPSLDQPRKTFLVSGQGDGAIIDLLRLRISQYRQDRILDDIFGGQDDLLAAFREVYDRSKSDPASCRFFDEFENIASSTDPKGVQFRGACESLRRRLRRDTEVILRIRRPGFSTLFDAEYAKSSFQNKLLLYMLYKCGAFTPTSLSEKKLVLQHEISKGCIIRRHGTQRKKQFKRILSQSLRASFKRALDRPQSLSITDEPKWQGGYFGFPGKTVDSVKLPDAEKKSWRKEYLPGPTALLSSAFCSSLAGVLNRNHPAGEQLRVTLHRAVLFGTDEEVLQQSCDYFGLGIGPESTSARAFPAKDATIGLAYQSRRIVRSRRGVDPEELRKVMKRLNLNSASQMSELVGFVLAIPLLEPEKNFRWPTPVAGVIYVDSQAKGFYVDDDLLRSLVMMAQAFIDAMATARAELTSRVRNVPLSRLGAAAPRRLEMPKFAAHALDLVKGIDAPRSSQPLQLNFDHSDFVPTHTNVSAATEQPTT